MQSKKSRKLLKIKFIRDCDHKKKNFFYIRRTFIGHAYARFLEPF
jgi:hypothetical protein